MMTMTTLKTTTFSPSSVKSFANTKIKALLLRRRNAQNRNLITTVKAVVSEDKTDDDTTILLPDEVKDLKLRDIISLWITQILQTYGDKPSSDNAPIVEGEIDDLVGGPIFLALYPYFR
jgi:hypothetical protein